MSGRSQELRCCLNTRQFSVGAGKSGFASLERVDKCKSCMLQNSTEQRHCHPFFPRRNALRHGLILILFSSKAHCVVEASHDVESASLLCVFSIVCLSKCDISRRVSSYAFFSALRLGFGSQYITIAAAPDQDSARKFPKKMGMASTLSSRRGCQTCRF